MLVIALKLSDGMTHCPHAQTICTCVVQSRLFLAFGCYGNAIRYADICLAMLCISECVCVCVYSIFGYCLYTARTTVVIGDFGFFSSHTHCIVLSNGDRRKFCRSQLAITKCLLCMVQRSYLLLGFTFGCRAFYETWQPMSLATGCSFRCKHKRSIQCLITVLVVLNACLCLLSTYGCNKQYE